MRSRHPEVEKYLKRRGSLGGKARAIALTPKRRVAIARAAALARWSKPKKRKGAA